ncbi:uncharacterized protein [Diadema setosum]|uniref:uncharacterized protein n=1 Tax=Diadema setosum TaxID=31175 RepID=UPI003B3AD8F7
MANRNDKFGALHGLERRGTRDKARGPPQVSCDPPPRHPDTPYPPMLCINDARPNPWRGVDGNWVRGIGRRNADRLVLHQSSPSGCQSAHLPTLPGTTGLPPEVSSNATSGYCYSSEPYPSTSSRKSKPPHHGLGADAAAAQHRRRTAAAAATTGQSQMTSLVAWGNRETRKHPKEDERELRSQSTSRGRDGLLLPALEPKIPGLRNQSSSMDSGRNDMSGASGSASSDNSDEYEDERPTAKAIFQSIRRREKKRMMKEMKLKMREKKQRLKKKRKKAKERRDNRGGSRRTQKSDDDLNRPEYQQQQSNHGNNRNGMKNNGRKLPHT